MTDNHSTDQNNNDDDDDNNKKKDVAENSDVNVESYENELDDSRQNGEQASACGTGDSMRLFFAAFADCGDSASSASNGVKRRE